MGQLSFEIGPWLASNLPDLLERETLAPLTIRVGANPVAVTQVYDSAASTVREHINVPLYPLAHWLVVNWWRLRWEAGPPPQSARSNWLAAHSLASISGDTPWPPLTFSSDGESIHLVMQAERASDVATIRYTESVNVDIPVADFETAVDELVTAVLARLQARHIADEEFLELLGELREERRDRKESARCQWQAAAGLDPGSATSDWLSVVRALRSVAGGSAGDELLAVIPIAHGGLATVQRCMAAMKQSGVRVDLRALPPLQAYPKPGQLPWQRGAALARALRQHVGHPSGPLGSKVLEELISAHLPLDTSDGGSARALEGGFRNGVDGGKTSVLIGSERMTSQRFFAARLVAAALMSESQQHLLPVTKAMTAFQKAERSFAQELLCPWLDLEEYVDEHGTDDDALADAADHFEVSEYVVRNTLVNKGYEDRDILP